MAANVLNNVNVRILAGMPWSWCRVRSFHYRWGVKLYKTSSGNYRTFHTLQRSNQYENNLKERGDMLRRTSPSLSNIYFRFVNSKHHNAIGDQNAIDNHHKSVDPEDKRKMIKAKKEARRKQLLENQKLNEQKKKEKQNIVYTSTTHPGQKKDTSCPLPDVYSPQYVEAAWYEWWNKMGFFSPQNSHTTESADKFVICLPPPNVTGTLHLGHALGNSIQDALIRWHRMHGRAALWNPGCDHAGIATQVVVEKKIEREMGKSRHDLGRDKFIQEVWKWKDEKGDIIYDQMKKMGCSLDWSRACFTLDPKLGEAVKEAFIRLHDQGLIYRRKRLVNWSCSLNSAISDIEVNNISLEKKTYREVPGYEKKVPFGVIEQFAYPVEDSDEVISVATTRLETMLGDTAVAVHPDDPRYSHLHGRRVTHPLCGRTMPIVCDTYVDKNFGTGAVKITPAHDHNDHDLGLRHDLDSINILDDKGHLINAPQNCVGMKRFDARREVQRLLQEKGLYEGERDHPMVIPVCSRSGDVIEPLMKDQWFVNCDEMAKSAIKAVRDGKLRLIPDNYEKVWYEWLENIRDWCISRQLWWGHRVPAYKVIAPQADNEVSPLWVSAHDVEDAKLKASLRLGVPVDEITLKQDEDVLDTWFSSAIFPFSIFGWPNMTSDLTQFYPTDLLETASDILFFWVARMVMLGQTLTGQLPFKEVLLHSIIRDAHGRKMSKSLGNIIDPMDVIHGISLEDLLKKVEAGNLDAKEVIRAKQGQKKDFPLGIPECGTDALRFTLCSYRYKAEFVNVDINHIHSHRKFCNKIWQAFRFCSQHWASNFQPSPHLNVQLKEHGTATDEWILSRLSGLVQTCDEAFKLYNLNIATQALYSFWYGDFCDIYLEYLKPSLQHPGLDEGRSVLLQQILYTCVDTGLRCLSPFMPYLTEELFQRLPGRQPHHSISICLAPYPSPQQYWHWAMAEVEEDLSIVREAITAALSLSSNYNLKKNTTQVTLELTSPRMMETFQSHMEVFSTLSRSQSVSVTQEVTPNIPGCVSVDVCPNCRVHLKLQGVVDVGKERQRLEKKQAKLCREVETLDRQIEDCINQEDMTLLHDKADRRKRASSELDKITKAIETLKTIDNC